jgi:hypothetical protein
VDFVRKNLENNQSFTKFSKTDFLLLNWLLKHLSKKKILDTDNHINKQGKHFLVTGFLTFLVCFSILAKLDYF